MQNENRNKMLKPQEFNWAIIGTGGIATQFARTLEAIQATNLIGVLGTSEAKAEQFISGLQQSVTQKSTTYDSIDSLINDEGVDAVYIATPHPSHFLYAQQLLRKNIAVLCEKPLTMTAREAIELITLSKQTNTFLMEAMWTKTLPSWTRIFELINQGALGKLDHISADIGFLFPYQPQHRLFNPKLGGGVLLDLGVYPLSLAHSIAGTPHSFYANCKLTSNTVDTKTLLQLEYENSVTANFYLTSHSNASNTFSIYGDHGSIRVLDIFSTSQTIDVAVNNHTTTESYPFEITGFEYQIRQSIDCIRSGSIEHPVVTHQSTIEVMRTLDKIRLKEGILTSFK